MSNTINIILASASPRRQKLMKEAGINFYIKAANIDEDFPSTMPPRTVAEFLAKEKAKALSEDANESIVIAADTTVLINNLILNKPEDHEDAIRMLSLLSGNMHEVITGVCFKYKDHQFSFTDTTKVFFRPLLPEEIKKYVQEFKPFDKAGAYGIQEWIGLVGIEKIEGSYFNVMGLPIQRVYDELKKFISRIS